MSKPLKIVLITLVSLVVLGVVGMNFAKKQTKKHSPETIEQYNLNGTEIEIFYCAPSKKGRTIFGELVPYGEVWRTGANEASTFKCNESINFGGATVPAGLYTLWTIPGKDSWKVILNSKQYGWGVDFSQKATREEAFDVAVVSVPVENLSSPVERFSITMDDNMNMVMQWDMVKISVPISKS